MAAAMITAVAGVARITVPRMTGVAVARMALTWVALGRVPTRGLAVGAGQGRQGKGED